MAQHNVLGKIGEDAATLFLHNKGYEILARNWKIGDLETDIIAKDGETIVFVEVKTRTEGGIGNPEDAVDLRRQQRLSAGAQAYLRYNQLDNPWRFDIIAIVKGLETLEINHIEDAFLPPAKTIHANSFNGQYHWHHKKK